MTLISCGAKLTKRNRLASEVGAVKGVVIMTNRKAIFGIMAVLACAAVILWSIDTYIRPGYQCGTDSLREANQTRDVLLEYKRLLHRQPMLLEVSDGFLRNEETGRRTETWGIVLLVDGKKVDQDTLPPEDRIPDELEGVQVQIIPAKLADMGITFVDPDLSAATPHFKRALHTIKKNRASFYRHPAHRGVSYFVAKSEVELDQIVWGIELFVAELVDQSTLPKEDQIPGCLEDIPVKISVDPNKGS